MMKGNNIEELIAKCLTGEASLDEQMQLGSWRIASPENEKYFQQLETIYQQATKAYEAERYDVDMAWQKVKAQIRKTPARQRWFYQPVALRVAAGIALIIATVTMVLWFRPTDDVKQIVITSAGTVVYDTLPNGVPIVLNKESKLEVSSDPGKRQTVVKLTGEAEFDIKSGTIDKLLVQADQVFIQHIGTNFNVKAYPEGNVEVTVFEGRVKFYSETNTGIFIDANQQGIYNKTTGVFSLESPGMNVQAYYTKQFLFENQSLQSIADQLNAVYDQKLIIPDHLKKCMLTVSFQNEAMLEIVSVMAETLGLTVAEVPGGFKLEGNGCQ